MAEDIFKVYMLGKFYMEYKGKEISFERNGATKPNQMLQILLCAGEKGVSRLQLMNQLFGEDEITDPPTSLRATVFRLRRLLEKAGLPKDEYVHISAGNYSWTKEIPVYVDALDFEKVVEQGLAKEDLKERYQYFYHACQLYGGDFLPFLTTENWAVVKRTRFKAIFSKALKELAPVLYEEKAYDKLLPICEVASYWYPFENWQLYQVKCFIEMKKYREAIDVYEMTAKRYFEEFGMQPSEELMEQIQKISGQIHISTESAIEIHDGLEEDENGKYGAFYCTYPNFLNIYRYLGRVMERSGISAHLLVIDVVDAQGRVIEQGERKQEITKHLKEAIFASLRKGDLFTQYSPDQHLVLLLSIKLEECKTVSERIQEKFKGSNRKCRLRFHAFPVADEILQDTDIHFEDDGHVWQEEV